jgi:RNA polymerase sigma factor (sigma-70 family)
LRIGRGRDRYHHVVPSTVATGDTPATFEEFAALRAPMLLRLAYIRLGNHHDAEDAGQYVLSVLCRKWESAIRYGAPDAYMRKILQNYCNRWWRRRLGRPAEVPVDYDDLQANGLLPSSDDPAVGVADRDFLRRCLQGMPRRQQQVLLLRYADDMPDEEIAALLGIASATVRQHAKAGKARLWDVLTATSDTS